MRLASFTVKNFRSITDAYKLPLRDFAVLVGPNNEGKSNVLKAIVVALGVLARASYYRTQKQIRYRYSQNDDKRYEWERDYPVSLQEDYPDGRSEFVLEFELTPAELSAFSKTIKINLATNLKVKLAMGREDAQFDVVIQGKAKKKLIGKLEDLAHFVGERIDIQYIPAVRPADLAEEVIDDLLARELALLEQDHDYQALLEQLELAHKPTLDSLSIELTKTVSGFIPEVIAVSIRSGALRRAVRRSTVVLIDDGNETALSMKGDGVKSLTALALLRHLSTKALGSRALILAIEEPESHLHPRAIHQLRGVLQDIAKTHQVILTTHSPVLVDRTETKRNIVVKDGKAVPAKHLKEVREALGVELADNLVSAALVLLVEGEEDVILLSGWLPKLSDVIGSALNSGQLAFDTLNGATNLKYKVSMHRAHLCSVHAFIDNDEAGRTALDATLAAALLDQSEYQAAVCQGMINSELEDFVLESAYGDALSNTFGVPLESKFMGTSKKKWSDRVRDNFNNKGKPWSKQLERHVKSVTANAAGALGISSLNPHRRGPIDALVSQLEARLVKP